jgi:hypothetical protein
MKKYEYVSILMPEGTSLHLGYGQRLVIPRGIEPGALLGDRPSALGRLTAPDQGAQGSDLVLSTYRKRIAVGP